MPLDYRPSDPAFLADPFPLFQRMRDEEPAHWSPQLKAWVLTRYDDVKRVCLDAERMSSDRLRPFFSSLPSPEAARMAELIRILTLWNSCIVVASSALQVLIGGLLRFLPLPISSLHLIRYSFRIPFRKLDWNFSNIDAVIQKWISLIC